MKIKILKFSLFLLALTALFISCNDDDINITAFVEADRGEQQIIDNDSIVAYLNSHYYNSSFFNTGSDYKYTDIVITELPHDDDGNYLDMPDAANNTLLVDAVETRTTEYLETTYEYYVLNLNQGGGGSPQFTDFVRVRYEGSSINDEVGGEEEIFDSSITPADLNLQSNGTTISGTIKAWQLIIPTFNASDGFSLVDGNVNFMNPGLGVMFVPSGLAYFSGFTTGSSYDNLIFKFELLQFETVDHDSDGIPSYVEDLDGDIDVVNDDTDEDLDPNFIDFDDDGDDVLTIDELIPGTRGLGETFNTNEFEISRSEINGVIVIKTVTIADSNNDGTPDYLDENITINYNADSN